VERGGKGPERIEGKEKGVYNEANLGTTSCNSDNYVRNYKLGVQKCWAKACFSSQWSQNLACLIKYSFSVPSRAMR